MSTYQHDVLIIGCGIAGLSAGIKLAEQGKNIAIVTREKDPKISNTYYAQGGIAVPTEDEKSFIEDIEAASTNTSYLPALEMLTKNGMKAVEELLHQKAKADFEKNDEGSFKKTMEAAHSEARILYKGDFTGKEIQVALLNYLKDSQRFPNVKFYTEHTAIDLLTAIHHGVSLSQRYEEQKVLGAYVFDQNKNQVNKILSKFTILATGGVGSLYLHHSNSEGARGDGHAMARRAGATLMNMEFIQFHPTTFFDSSAHRRFLVSEAVRGEGGILLNSSGQRFMERYHRDMELAPRDVVSRAIAEESIETLHECVYLDISHKDASWIKDRFPTIYNHCLEHNLDITTTPIPVVPAAHYTCGGIKTDLVGRTSLPNLYAVGEVACTGVHGANRLASTSLLEGLTWGYMAAEDLSKRCDLEKLYDGDLLKDWEIADGECDLALVQQDWMTVKQTMWNYVGLIRSSNRLLRARAMFHELYDEVQRFYKNAQMHDELIGLRNAVEVAQMVLSASLRNQESIGCFYRK